MNCPICRHADSRVIHTDADATEIKRRRECLQCRHRWTTFERTQAELERLDKIREAVRPLADLLT